MKKTSKTIIDEKDPFLNCKLEREPIADSLTKIIEGIDGSFVLGIDSPWGTGKSTFIEMWVQKLKNEKQNDEKQNDEKQNNIFPIYFNAWENDFHGEVLSALVGELEKYLKNNKNVKKDDYLKVIGNIAGNVTTLVTGGVVNPIKLKEELNSTGKRILFDDYQTYETLKNEIKNDLEELKTKLKVQKIIFFIDELDRCRPDYAVQTLEKIKHFFNVDDYVFVLALDKKQLSHSVATIYGEGMDSEGYLRRFIDLDYSFPNPSKEKYLDYLIETHNLNEKEKNIEWFTKVIRNFAKEKSVSLRDLEKLFYKIKLVLPLAKFYNGVNDPQGTIKLISGVMYAYFICLSFKYNDVYVNLTNGHSDILYYDSEKPSNDNSKLLNEFYTSMQWVKFENSLSEEKMLEILKVINKNCDEIKDLETIDLSVRVNEVDRNCNFSMNNLFERNRFIIKDHIDFIEEFN